MTQPTIQPGVGTSDGEQPDRRAVVLRIHGVGGASAEGLLGVP